MVPLFVGPPPTSPKCFILWHVEEALYSAEHQPRENRAIWGQELKAGIKSYWSKVLHGW